MSKTQYWTLNSFALILTGLLLGHYLFSVSNRSLTEATRRGQAQIATSRQMEVTLDQMAKRLALGSETDPQLKDILTRYGLSVTLEIEGQTKTYP